MWLFFYCVVRPKDDKGKKKAEGDVVVPEELLAALSFADIGGTGGVPPWALGGPEWDQENGGLTETHIKVLLYGDPHQGIIVLLYYCTTMS